MLPAAIIQAIVTAILVGITWWYVRLTKGILSQTANYTNITKAIYEETAKQSRLQYSPVLGIDIATAGISPVFGDGRRNLGVKLRINNVGNSAAIEVLVDAAVILQFAKIEGYDIGVAVSRFHPACIPFIEAGHVVDEKDERLFGINFGNRCIDALVDDINKCWDTERWKEVLKEAQRGERPFARNWMEAFEMLAQPPRLRIVAYYRNHLEQYFKSAFETTIDLPKELEETEPYDVRLMPIPRPSFHAEPITKERMTIELEAHEAIRDIGGW